MEITAFAIYLIGVVNPIAVVTLILGLFGALGWGWTSTALLFDSPSDIAAVRKLRRIAGCFALLLPVAVLIPTKETITAMIALPPIINSENVQELPANLVNYLNTWLKENAKAKD